MSVQTWEELLVTSQADGPSLSNTVTATSILPITSKYTFPANYFQRVGQMLRIRAMGRLSNIVTSPGTLTLDFRLGGTVVFNGGAMQLSTTAHTTLPFWFDIMLTLRAAGSSANFMGQAMAFGQQFSISAADSTSTHTMLMAPNTTPAVGTNFDATASQALDFFATFNTANAGNLILVHQFSVEAQN